jgi:hypothetical protein
VVFETGIKAIDLLAPLECGGKGGMFGGAGVGKTVLINELIHNMAARAAGGLRDDRSGRPTVRAGLGSPAHRRAKRLGNAAGTIAAQELHQYFFVSLFRARAKSQASEHASRLAAMQSAERNLDERLGEVTGAYRRARQDAITAELLDVVAGFEAIAAD